jgi:hypothetical protein
MTEITFSPKGGGTIFDAARDAIQSAKDQTSFNLPTEEATVRVSFLFNGISLVAYNTSEVRDIVEKYSFQTELRRKSK